MTKILEPVTDSPLFQQNELNKIPNHFSNSHYREDLELIDDCDDRIFQNLNN